MASIREQITQDVVAALGQISVLNGYQNDIHGGIQRYEQDGATLSTPPSIIVTFAGERKERSPNGMFTCLLELDVEIYAVDNVVASTATYIDTLVEDVEKALLADPTRSGLAIDSHPTQVETFPPSDGAPFAGAAVTIAATYRHSATDPAVP